MNKGLIMMGLSVTLISGGYALAATGEHQMPDGTTMNDSAMGIGKVPIEPTAEIEAAVKLVEVGNKICPVSGEKVGGPMGDGLSVEHNGKMYKLCCEGCLKDFEKDPAKYTKIADDEVAKTAEESVN